MADEDSRSIKRKFNDSEAQLIQQSTEAGGGTGFFPEENEDTREASQLTQATQSSASHGDTQSTGVLPHEGEEEETTTQLDITDHGDVDDEDAKDERNEMRLQVITSLL
jgi:hypothetical protein